MSLVWLIDHNLPHTFYRVLREKNIRCQTTGFAKLGHLENGKLTQAAIAAGFKAIITRDKTFAVAAKDVLINYSNFSIVVIQYNQSPKETLGARFEKALEKYGMIMPKAGSGFWPENDEYF